MARTISNLLANPRYLPRYVSHNLLQSKLPLDLELPTFSYAAIDFLKDFLRPDMNVAEYGSGPSTLFFARRVQRVFAVEDQLDRFMRLSARLRSLGFEHVRLELFPFDVFDVESFRRSNYLNAFPEDTCMVFAVHNHEGGKTLLRPICFQHAEERIQPGGIILVNDSWRYPELRKENKALRVETFQSVGPYRPGLVSTDVFFY